MLFCRNFHVENSIKSGGMKFMPEIFILTKGICQHDPHHPKHASYKTPINYRRSNFQVKVEAEHTKFIPNNNNNVSSNI